MSNRSDELGLGKEVYYHLDVCPGMGLGLPRLITERQDPAGTDRRSE
jgi:hypothetical protein